LKKNNRKLRKLITELNFKVAEAAKVNKGNIVAVDIAGMGLKGNYYNKVKEQIQKQGAWNFSYIRGGTKLVLKSQG
jgi:vacuolar-type H+-ATPase subunit B/Vma2